MAEATIAQATRESQSRLIECEHVGQRTMYRRGVRVHADDSRCWGRDGRLLQIVTAHGVMALYTSPHADEKFSARVLLWGLYEVCDGSRVIRGIDPAGEGWIGEPADSASNFHAYVDIEESEARQ